MYNNCQYETSCKKCKHKCKEYKDYIRNIDSESLLQGIDRHPLKREHGALKRR